jgi:hypothetical protein
MAAVTYGAMAAAHGITIHGSRALPRLCHPPPSARHGSGFPAPRHVCTSARSESRTLPRQTGTCAVGRSGNRHHRPPFQNGPRSHCLLARHGLNLTAATSIAKSEGTHRKSSPAMALLTICVTPYLIMTDEPRIHNYIYTSHNNSVLKFKLLEFKGLNLIYQSSCSGITKDKRKLILLTVYGRHHTLRRRIQQHLTSMMPPSKGSNHQESVPSTGSRHRHHRKGEISYMHTIINKIKTEQLNLNKTYPST